MSDISKLRTAVWHMMHDTYDAGLSDDEWYDQLWTLLDPVIDARAERQLAAAVNSVSDEKRDAERCPATWNPGVWPYTTRCVWKAGHEGLRHVDRDGNTYTETVEQHRFSFEASNRQLADHLVAEHGLTLNTVARWRDGLTQGDWTALDDLHRAAHERGL
jgi:hypothetical protein